MSMTLNITMPDAFGQDLIDSYVGLQAHNALEPDDQLTQAQFAKRELKEYFKYRVRVKRKADAVAQNPIQEPSDIIIT